MPPAADQPTGQPWPRWLFIDMNSFFASAEQHLRPELRGRPVGVIPVESETSCVIAASFDAKAHGVRTGTRVTDARRLCPGIRLVRARPDLYVDLHHAIAQAITRHLPCHRAYSIDEWAIRLQASERLPERARELALAIKREIRETFSEALTCSVGVAATRLLAKIACDLHKPDGLTMLPTGDMPAPVEHLGPHELCGISDGILARLHSHGVRDVRALWALSRDDSARIWGSVEGARWWAGFHGVDEPEIPTRRRSMGHANVLEPRFRTQDGARQVLIRLTNRLCLRLRDADMVAGRLDVGVKDIAHNTLFHAHAPLPDTQSTPEIMRCFAALWEQRAIAGEPGMVHVTLSNLTPRDQATGCLFGRLERETRLSRTLDTINKRWGIAAAYPGSLHGCCHRMDNKIAFGRIPESLLRNV